MRILELTGEPIGTGGQEMFIINLLRHIDLTDLQIDWLTPYYCENDTYRKEVEDKGGRVICFNLHFNPGGSRNNIVNPLNNFLKKNYYDVVHIHSGITSVLALCAFVAKWNKVKKIIVHSHSTGLSKSLKHYVLRMITNPILSMCPTHYLACSVDAGVWKFPASVVRGKLQIINNGIDLNLFAPDETKRLEYRKMLDISDKTMVIGNVGRFSYVKNQEFLIEIVSQLKQRRKNIKLMLVGVGETMNEIKSLVVSKKLTEDVLFIGGVNNVYDYMQAMDIFAFPSRWEGLGMVGVEAQAIGMPVVASTAVPISMKLVDDVVFLSLDDINAWLGGLNRDVLKSHVNNTDIMRRHGYDINLTAKDIRVLYTQDRNKN